MLSERIRDLRRRQGLSQEQLAEKVGVSRQAVSKWEGGLSVPEMDKLLALCDCFGVTMDELTRDEVPGPAPDCGKTGLRGDRKLARRGTVCPRGGVLADFWHSAACAPRRGGTAERILDGDAERLRVGDSALRGVDGGRHGDDPP